MESGSAPTGCGYKAELVKAGSVHTGAAPYSSAPVRFLDRS